MTVTEVYELADGREVSSDAETLICTVAQQWPSEKPAQAPGTGRDGGSGRTGNPGQ